jgi:alpha-D-ribose 1-methylphosphonate 5-triphosphate diphosphatase
MILTNCRVVTHQETFDGTVVAERGAIAAIDRGRSQLPAAIDLNRNFLIPGLVEVHTDNLERHLQPRSARWPAVSALLAHDALIAGVGITTVLDAVCLGIDHDIHGQPRDFIHDSIRALRHAKLANHLRADHYLHYRCELPHPRLVAEFDAVADEPDLRLVSLMDHTPGQRQVTDLARLRKGFERMGPVNDEWFERTVRQEQEKQAKYADSNRRLLVERLEDRDLALASHDDADAAHVGQAVRDGAGISEFPTTLEAARAAKQAGLKTVMGAPNVILGGSQSGNLSAVEAVQEGVLDALSSDYAPVSLLEGAFAFWRHHGVALERAIAMVTWEPAAMVGLDDRGRIGAGMRADLVEVDLVGDTPRARRVWRRGERVA